MDRRTFLALASAGTALGAAHIAGLGSAALGLDRVGVAVAPHPAARAARADQRIATVPLRIVDIGGGQLKVGIHIRLGGGEPRLYTFDTGSSGFYAAFNRDWWPSYRRVGGPPISQSYGSDETFQSKIVRTVIGIPTEDGELEVETEVGQIHDAWGGSLGPKSSSPWRKDTAAGRPPLFGHFFGDFGSGLTEKNGLFAVLPQLPGNLSSGFALRLGCDGRPTSTPQLQIGLDDALRDEVTSWVPMLRERDAPAYPLSRRPSYAQRLVAGRFRIASDTDAYDFDAQSILDTGGPTTSLHEHGAALRVPDAFRGTGGRRLASDLDFRVRAEGTDVTNGFDLDFSTGTAAGTDLVSLTSSGDAFVNLGLIPFFRYTVVFDVENGLVGFAPCTSPT